MKKKTLTLEVGLQIIFANEIISRTKKELDTEMAWFSFLQKRKRNQQDFFFSPCPPLWPWTMARGREKKDGVGGPRMKGVE